MLSDARTTRRGFLAAGGAIVAVAALPGAALGARKPTRFIARSGTRLTLAGAPWRLYGGSCYGTLNPGGQGTINGTVQLALGAGLNTVRLVNFIDETGTSAAAPYDAAAWTRVDQMLATLAGSGLRAILDLSCYRNHLQNYLLNTGQTTTTPYSQDWGAFVRFVAKRVNTVTGVPYRRDPTIALVSFAGEPNPPNSQEPLKPTTSELTNFYSRVFSQWRLYDTNHLLSPGGLLHIDWEEAFNNPNGSGIDWRAIFSLPGCDVPAIHSYWHAFPPSAPTDYRSKKVSTYCSTIQKPWITEEFGFLQTPTDYSTTPPTIYTEQDRGSWYQLVYDIQAGAYASSDGILPSAGVAFWNLGAEVAAASHDVNPQTPYTWSTVQANA
jgi:mannan endo-1,4-beta-mannosidase